MGCLKFPSAALRTERRQDYSTEHEKESLASICLNKFRDHSCDKENTSPELYSFCIASEDDL